jgi:two-component system, response regulator PdtaR
MNKQVKILIVEDETIISTLLKKLLEIEGFKIIETVTSGDAAIEISKKKDLDLILMDIHISGSLNGIDTARIIKEKNKVEIIFITGYPDMETREKAREINPLGFFIKPLDINELFILIKKNFKVSNE